MRNRLQFAAASILAAGIAAAPAALAQEKPPRPPTGTRAVYIGKGGGSFLGVGAAEIDSERAKALNLKEERGVEIKSVSKDSPAAKAGLKEGDVVLEFNGQAVQGTEQFQRLVREIPPGREVKLTVWRGGSTQTVTATLETRKGATIHTDDGEFHFSMPNITIPMPDIPRFEMSWRNPMLGIDGESLNSQLAEFFGVKDGVLVRSVVKNSAADKAGIKAGDVITKVDASNITSVREITTALRGLGSKKTFPVTVIRNKKEMAITVTIEERSSGTRARSSRTVRAPRVKTAVRGALRYC